MSELAHLEKRQQYCQDWLETDEPWERWERRVAGNGGAWRSCTGHPSWSKYQEYRRKPRTFMVGDVEVRPVQEKLGAEELYYLATPTQDVFFTCETWRDDFLDNMFLKRGLIHLNKEDAIAHGKALAALTGGE